MKRGTEKILTFIVMRATHDFSYESLYLTVWSVWVSCLNYRFSRNAWL